MTALLEALRRLETQRPSRRGVATPVASPSVAAPISAAVVDETAATVEVEDDIAADTDAEVNAETRAEEVTVEPASIPFPRRRQTASRAAIDPALNSRATVADDLAGAAASLAVRFRAPALVALVTCGAAEVNAAIVDSLGLALQSQGYPTTVFSSEEESAAAYGLDALEELRAGRGYHLLHTTAEAALERTPLLALADGVVVLVELERTPIAEAEAIVGLLRREAVAVSGILLIA